MVEKVTLWKSEDIDPFDKMGDDDAKTSWTITTPIMADEPDVYVDESTYPQDLYEAVQKSAAVPQPVKDRLRKLAIRAGVAMGFRGLMNTASSIHDPEMRLEGMSLVKARAEGITKEQAMSKILKTAEGMKAWGELNERK